MKVAIYSRKSKETDTGESIQNQIKMCKDYFNRQYTDCEFEIFEDEGFSGSNTNRPSFKRMLQLAKHSYFDVIACYKVDRIARNIIDFFDVYKELELANVKLVSITEGFDANTPIGRMLMTMLAGFADMERENIRQRVTDNMRELGKLGRWSGGTCPTGYRSVTINAESGKKETYLELIPEMSETILGIFNKISQGYSCREVGKIFNMPSKTIANIIINPTYLPATKTSSNYLGLNGYEIYGDLNGNGFLAYNRRPKKNGKKLYKAPGMFVSTSLHKTIISDELWIKANEVLKSRAVDPTKHPRISKSSFLAQMITCKCGNKMIVESKKHPDGTRTFYFRCSGKKDGKIDCDSKWIRVDEAEEKILSDLHSCYIDNAILQHHINSSKKTNYDLDIKKTTSLIVKKKNEINKLTERLIYIEGPAINIISDKINSISEEITKLNENLLILERTKILNSNELNLELLKKSIGEVLYRFDELTIEEQQIKIRKVIKKITYDGYDSLHIKLS